MAVISRSIPAVPYQGGAMLTQQPYSCAVQLTSTRMVWTYCQQNPNWRFFVVVDTPDGWANGGTPTVTVARMQDQRIYGGGALHMVRLNDNAFAVFDLNSISTSISGNWTAEVFEIDSNNQFNRTYYNQAWSDFASPLQSSTSQTAATMKFNCLMSFIPLKDNNVFQVSAQYNGNIFGSFLTYDNTKTLTTSLARTAPGGYTSSSILCYNLGTSNATQMQEVYWRAIPSSTKYSICWRGGTSYATSYAAAAPANNTIGGVMIDFAPWLASATTAPTITGTGALTAGNGYYSNNVIAPTSSNTFVAPTGDKNVMDFCHMSETRTAHVNWQNAYFFDTTRSTEATGNAMVSQGGAEFATATSTNPMIAYPLDANYIMLMDRTHFVSSSSGDIKLKIIRRDDSNFVSVSPGSNTGTGFTVTVPWIEVWRAHQRPRMMTNGDLFWWGLDSSGNLTWNIIKNAVASS